MAFDWFVKRTLVNLFSEFIKHSSNENMFGVSQAESET